MPADELAELTYRASPCLMLDKRSASKIQPAVLLYYYDYF